jgi:hypothetical protein
MKTAIIPILLCCYNFLGYFFGNFLSRTTQFDYMYIIHIFIQPQSWHDIKKTPHPIVPMDEGSKG